MTGNSPNRATLLQQLLAMRIEEPGASLSFEQALAADQGWSRGRAEAVSSEYRRFLYLAATSAREVTPSLAVDRAWHLHLTHSRHYWEEMCGSMLGRPLHHRPSSGGAIESEQYQRQYEDTLAIYEATFGTPPPPSIWPRRALPAHGRGAPPHSRDGADPNVFALLGWIGLSLSVAFGAGAMAGMPAFLAAVAIIFLIWLVAESLTGDGPLGRRGCAAGSCGGGGSGWMGDCGDGGGAGCGGGCGGD